MAPRPSKLCLDDRDVVVYLGYDLLHLEKYDDLLALTTKYLTTSCPRNLIFRCSRAMCTSIRASGAGAAGLYRGSRSRSRRGYSLCEPRIHVERPSPAGSGRGRFRFGPQESAKRRRGAPGLAYANLDLNKPQTALRQAQLAEQEMGDSRDIHVIRATAYGREDMLTKAANRIQSCLEIHAQRWPRSTWAGKCAVCRAEIPRCDRRAADRGESSPGNADT